MNVIIVFPKMENGKYIKRILQQNGYEVHAVCTTGAQALQYANELSGGIVVCGYRFADMIYSELYDYLPRQFEMLLIASASVCSNRERKEDRKKPPKLSGDNRESRKDTSIPFGAHVPCGDNRETLKDTSMPCGDNREIICLSMPLMVHELVQTMHMMSVTVSKRQQLNRRKKERTKEEKKLLFDAKELLMERNHMTEEEAHRYLQKRSMDNGIGIVETAQMVLSMLNT